MDYHLVRCHTVLVRMPGEGGSIHLLDLQEKLQKCELEGHRHDREEADFMKHAETSCYVLASVT